MKITFYETSFEDRQTLSDLLKPFPNIKAEFIVDKLSESNIKTDAEAISVFVGSEVKKAQIDQMPNLKFISTRSTGFDHIDVNYAKTKNIQVSNVPAYGSRTVAEFTFGLVLSLSRKLFLATNQIKEGKGFDYQSFEGFNLQHKTLGIIGTGKIGLNVAKIAKGFEMNILGFDAFPNIEKEKEFDFKYVQLDDLLKNSDVITLHVPYMKATHHLINKSNINLVKKGAVLINTSRGEVVDTEALLVALKGKILSGAGLDVLEGERMLKEADELILQNNKNHPSTEELKVLIENHTLINMQNVIITPHIAFFSKEAKKEILKTTVENLVGFISKNPINLL